MLDHVGFPVSDYVRSKAFNLQALEPLGYVLVMEVQQDENDNPAAGFGMGGKPDFWIGGEGGLQRPTQIAAQNRAAVDAFHRVALAPAARITTRPACGRITIQTTTRPSCSIRTVTISKPCATRRPRRAY